MLVNYTTKEVDLMARLMRAEALSDGNEGMLMVGNVIVNRALGTCDLFTNIRSIYDVVYQSPGGLLVLIRIYFNHLQRQEKKSC